MKDTCSRSVEGPVFNWAPVRRSLGTKRGAQVLEADSPPTPGGATGDKVMLRGAEFLCVYQQADAATTLSVVVHTDEVKDVEW